MDGNGRWAEAQGLPRLSGHRAGTTALREVVRTARTIGLEAVTMYAFSSENWGRPSDEIAGLMALLRDYLHAEREELMTNQIRFLAIGDLARLPDFVTQPLHDLVALTAGNAAMTLTLALSYGEAENRLPQRRARLANGWRQAR